MIESSSVQKLKELLKQLLKQQRNKPEKTIKS